MPLGSACRFEVLPHSLSRNIATLFECLQRWRPAYWALFPFGCGLILLCKLNYMEGPRAGMASRVAIACLLKPVFGFATLILVLGMIFKMESKKKLYICLTNKEQIMKKILTLKN